MLKGQLPRWGCPTLFFLVRLDEPGCVARGEARCQWLSRNGERWGTRSELVVVDFDPVAVRILKIDLVHAIRAKSSRLAIAADALSIGDSHLLEAGGEVGHVGDAERQMNVDVVVLG